jgi:glycosyltransferase involved in cell wall biosynthesis
MIKSVIYGLLAAAAARVPHRFALITGLGSAFTEQPNWRWRVTNRLARLLYGLSLRFASGVAFQNSDDERDFRRWKLLPAATPTIVVDGSGVDTSYFRPQPLPPEPHCLMVARLVKDKGVFEFIEAARIVRNKCPAARFVILGAEETSPAAVSVDFVRAAEAAGLIVYQGPVTDVRPHIAVARIFVLPSYYREGIPRSVLEAMAMGRPIVTTDVPGCRETVVAGRNGLLVPARDAKALAAAILALIDDPERAAAMGRESRSIAEQRYDVGKVTNDLLGFFWRATRPQEA